MKKYLLTLLVISMPFAFSACDDDDDNDLNGQENTFTYDGESYAIDHGLLFYYGEYGGAHDYDLILHSDGISFEEESFSGNGNALIFIIYSDSATGLTPGSYNYEEDEEPFSFMEGEMLLEFDIATESGTEMWIEGGSIDVERSGNTYTLEINVTAEDGKPIRGTFEGGINLIDYSEEEWKQATSTRNHFR